MARKGMLPVQAWDEINVSNDRVKTPQSIVIKMPKEKKRREKKTRKGK